jgi:poly(3-hydroxybutyrate) depolymerase
VVLLTMGDVNTFNSVTTGEENFSYASVTGYLNNISITQSGTKGLVILDIAGNQNTATVTQSGGGALGHWTNLSVSGNLNTHTIAQSGTAADSVVDIKTTGGSNNFNINVNSR